MKAEIIGIKRVEYTKNNQEVKGVKVFLGIQKKNVRGMETTDAYFSDKRIREDLDIDFETVEVGDEVELEYNQYGGIDNISTT